MQAKIDRLTIERSKEVDIPDDANFRYDQDDQKIKEL